MLALQERSGTRELQQLLQEARTQQAESQQRLEVAEQQLADLRHEASEAAAQLQQCQADLAELRSVPCKHASCLAAQPGAIMRFCSVSAARFVSFLVKPPDLILQICTCNVRSCGYSNFSDSVNP